MAEIVSLIEFRDARERQTATATPLALEKRLDATTVAWWVLARSLEAVTWETLALAEPAVRTPHYPETGDGDVVAAAPWLS